MILSKALSLFFQDWAISCLSFLSDWYYICNVYGITLGLDVGTDQGPLYGSIDSSNYGKIDGLLIGGSLGSTGCKLLDSSEGIKLVISDVKLLCTILGNVYGIIIWLDVGTYLGLLDGSFDGYNDDNIEGLLLGDLLGSTDGKVLGSYEGIKLGISDGKVIGNILGNVDGITLGIDVGTELVSLDVSIDGSNYGKI